MGLGADGADKAQQRKVVSVPSGIGYSSVPIIEEGTWHANRKRAIMEAHPEIRNLFGPDPRTAVYLAFLLPAHVAIAYYTSGLSWWLYLPIIYTVGAVMAFQLMCIGHEGSHRVVFKSDLGNKIVATLGFMPLFCAPFGAFWMVEHFVHHQEVVDKCLRFGPPSQSTFKKALLALLSFNVLNLIISITSALTFIQGTVSFVWGALGNKVAEFKPTMPPFDRFPQATTPFWFASYVVVMAFHASIIYFLGWKPFFYIMLSAGFMNGLHPLGMRNIQEHYWVRSDQPTYSNYTPWGLLSMNINCHVEHHDFSNIAWTRLPEVRKIAPEFYDNLFYYNGYFEVMYKYLFDPKVTTDAFYLDAPVVASHPTESKKQS